MTDTDKCIHIAAEMKRMVMAYVSDESAREKMLMLMVSLTGLSFNVGFETGHQDGHECAKHA